MVNQAWLSLRARGRGRGFPPATVSMTPGYFHREQKKNKTKGTPEPFHSPPTNWIYPAT